MEYTNYIIETIEKLVNIPSPSGFTASVMEFIEKEVTGFGYHCSYLKKGGMIITVPGTGDEIIGLSAHVDTLGAMVRSINSNGNLKLTAVGGMMMESLEGSYCKIHTRGGKIYTGTILTNSPSVHVYDDARTLERKEKNMEIRIDERVSSKKDVLALGINSGDYVSFDPLYEYTKSGFVKTRHLDDKASVAVILSVLKELSETGKVLSKGLKVLISNYEEVGFGASFVPDDITELLAVDMGAVGDDLNGDEFSVSICAKDSTGPYDYEMTSRLINIAKDREIKYVIDVFPHYGSDVSAALRGGNDIRGALIGPGVHASHGMERTHAEALEATFKLIQGYLGL